tara:strand:+ start:11294 stop:11890 length:597 start_codon:yes stop_codon:yes gene_type:complete
MKKLFTLILCLFIFTLVSAFTVKTYRTYIAPVKTIESLPLKQIEVEMPLIEVKIDIKDHDAFLNALGHQESGNRYDIVNRFGYMGKYQFGKSTLKTLKIKVSKQAFLNSPDLQEFAMQSLLEYNKKRLEKYINQYDGHIVHGVLVTESGLLAAAHLGGQGSVKKWFRTGKIREDGNGVKITNYMQRFGGYNLNLDIYN